MHFWVWKEGKEGFWRHNSLCLNSFFMDKERLLVQWNYSSRKSGLSLHDIHTDFVDDHCWEYLSPPYFFSLPLFTVYYYALNIISILLICLFYDRIMKNKQISYFSIQSTFLVILCIFTWRLENLIYCFIWYCFSYNCHQFCSFCSMCF